MEAEGDFWLSEGVDICALPCKGGMKRENVVGGSDSLIACDCTERLIPTCEVVDIVGILSSGRIGWCYDGLTIVIVGLFGD